MEVFKACAAKYNHTAALATFAIFFLTYFAFRSVSPDLMAYAGGVATILTGTGLTHAAKGWGDGQAATQ